MGTKEQLSSDQWKSFFNAPFAAATFVSTASGGGFEMLGEIINATKFMQRLAEQPSGSGYGVLVDDLLSVIKGMSKEEAKESAFPYQSKDPQSLRAEAKQLVANGAAVAGSLTGGDGYKRWILDMAREVAATKSGGFLGIGGKSVIDEKEEAAIQELADLIR
jgi:hypothetical protein